MAISEVNALFDLLAKANDVASIFIDNYNQASDEIQAFRQKVRTYEEKTKQWEQLLRRYSLPQDHPAVVSLREAVGMLQEQGQAVQSMQQKTCCVRVWSKAVSPKSFIDNLKGVEEAYKGILDCLEEKHRMERLAEEEANKIKAPFSFAGDEKYVPVMETVEKVRKALQCDDSSQKVVLVHGGSGEGKSTLAKFLALDYYKKSKEKPFSSELCRFSDGVVFIFCGEKADSFSLVQKLWLDLGYSLDPSQLPQIESDGSTDRRAEFELLKRKLMSRLDNGKSVLIVLDDACDSLVIADLMMPQKGVNYLITSQRWNIWPDATEYVQIGTPSIEEARKILANHIAGWKGKPFPAEVQGEVDRLIAEVQNHPLVIANLASRIKCENVAKVDKWTHLRKQLKNTLQAAPQLQSVPNFMFNTLYQHSAVASLTMAIDQITEMARSLMLMLAICTGHGVHENVLTLWFKAVHGADTFTFDDAFDDLQARSLVLITKTEVKWSNDPLNIYSIHDLRRQLLPEMYKEAVENILEKLTGSERSTRGREGLVSESSGESEEDLVASLFFVYGDEKFKQKSLNRIKIHSDLLRPAAPMRLKSLYSRRENWLDFVKTIGQLLHPSLEEASDWEKKTHGLAKTVILHFLQSAELKDYAASTLLEIPESKPFVVTCYALHSLAFCYLPGRIPMTIRSLAMPLRKWTDEPSVFLSNVHTCLKSFYICRNAAPFIVVRDLPILLRKLLELSQVSNSSNSLSSDTAVTRTVLSLLEVRRRSNRVPLAAAPRMLETILNFLDPKFDSDQTLLLQASKTFRILACSETDIKAKTIQLPNVLEFLVRMLPLVPDSTLDSLTELAWTRETADSIASYPGALDGIVYLLKSSSKAQSNAVLCLGQLASFESTRTIIVSTCPRAFRTLIQLLTQDASSELLADISIAVRKVVSDDTEFELETSVNFLTEVIQKLDLLLGENMPMTVRGCAAEALGILASKQPICKSLEAYPGLLEQICRIPASADTTVECMEFVYRAVRGIFIEGKGLGESRRMALVDAAVKMYTTLLQDDKAEPEVQRKAAKGLGIICRKSEFWLVVAEARAGQILMSHMKKDPTFYMSREGAYIVEDIFLKPAKLAKVGRAGFVGDVLKFYVAFLRRGYKVEPQKNAEITAVIAQLANWKEIRQLLTDGNSLVLLLDLGPVTEGASPRTLICVAVIICKVCRTEHDHDEPRRMILLTRSLETYVALLADGIGIELREAATESLLILASNSTQETRKLLLTDETAVNLLLGLVREESSSGTLYRVAYLLQSILVNGSELEEVHKVMCRAVKSFVDLLADGIPVKAQEGALRGLARLAFRQENGEIRVAHPGALNQLTLYLEKADFRGMFKGVCEVVELISACRMESEDIQEYMSGVRINALQGFLSVMEGDVEYEVHNSAALCLCELFRYETNRKLLPWVFPSGDGGLSEFVDGIGTISQCSMEAFTFIDPGKAEKMNLSSAPALEGRLWARTALKQYKSALEDCDRALELESSVPSVESLLQKRSFIKVQLGDVEGALEDLNGAVESVTQRTKWASPGEWQSIDDSLTLEERGILKSLILDYNGALLDLNDSLRLDPEDYDDYEVLKYRGYVKFCLGDEEGARFDAEQANCTRFRTCDFPLLRIVRGSCLGVAPVRYLGFEL